MAKYATNEELITCGECLLSISRREMLLLKTGPLICPRCESFIIVWVECPEDVRRTALLTGGGIRRGDFVPLVGYGTRPDYG